MKMKYINVYGVFAIVFLAAAVIWFALSVTAETRKGIVEAELSFTRLARESTSASISNGFMSDTFIQKLTSLCQQSRLLSALAISTPSGTVFAWPDRSTSIEYDMRGKPSISNTSLFMKVYSTSLDIGEGAEGSVVMTAVIYVLHPDAIFSASRNSFLAILAILFTTFIVIIAVSPQKKRMQAAETGAVIASADKTVTDDLDDTAFSLPSIQLPEELDETYDADEYALPENQETYSDESPEDIPSREVASTENIRDDNKPEGLFSPLTGIGWEQYLSDRLEAELVRAASSEQDLSLIVIRVAGLLHTDLISRKISQVLLDAFKFRDMVFEFGANGFAGILQNVNLDQAMKVADTLYAGIDSLLMEMSFEGQITIGITTRTARLLPASRMIEEAVSAAKKAEEEPSLPIVAFRANPEKYRDFVADNA